METQTLQVFSLRGMDERWIVQPQDALYIEDMTWTSNDSWRTSGGFFQMYKPDPFFKFAHPDVSPSGYEMVNVDPKDEVLYSYKDDDPAKRTNSLTNDFIVDPETKHARFPKIKSLHWFAQHNGARQWLILEKQVGGRGSGKVGEPDIGGDLVSLDDNEVPLPTGKTQLMFFSGAKARPDYLDYEGSPVTLEPTESIFEYQTKPGSSLRSIAQRTENIQSRRTNSQSYGGRIYFVNGVDDPIVFDGRFVERAGFYEKPPSPTGLASNNEASFTFPYAAGDFYGVTSLQLTWLWT